MNNFTDTSTNCAIYLEPFQDEEYSNSITPNADAHQSQTKKTITLSCGHCWHLDYLHNQLQHAQPTQTTLVRSVSIHWMPGVQNAVIVCLSQNVNVCVKS